jgi:ATP-dependent protease Clp ATPase subunit
MKNLFVYKLISGEEILGVFVEENKGVVCLKEVLQVHRILNDGMFFFSLRPWFIQQFETKDNVIEIKESSFISRFKPDNSVVEQYKSTLEYLNRDNSEDLINNFDSDTPIFGTFSDSTKYQN